MDWSDHAIWWPTRNIWLDKTRLDTLHMDIKYAIDIYGYMATYILLRFFSIFIDIDIDIDSDIHIFFILPFFPAILLSIYILICLSI